MAKITRITQKIFGSNAGLSEIGVFGSLAAGSPTFTSSPAAVQSLSNFLDGWFAAVVGENSPAIQDMNGLCFVYAYQLAYLMQQGIAEWDSGTTYYIGSMAQDGLGNIYISLQNSNLNNALSNTSFWSNSSGTTSTVTSNTTIAAGVGMVRSNTTSGNLTMTLPAVASVPVGKKITIKDVGTGSFATTVMGNGAELIDGNNTFVSVLAQYDALSVFNNGTSWDVV